MGYREHVPRGGLRGLLECGWTAVSGAGECVAVLPDGCMDLVWTGSVLLVAGPDTSAHAAHRPPGSQMAGLRFRPGALPALLGVPADAVRDQRVPLEQLHPRLARMATSRLEAREDSLATLAALVHRLPGEPPDAATALLADHLAAVAAPGARSPAGPPAEASLCAVADALGCTPRTLHRRSLAAFGYGPAMLRRVLRFRRAAALLAAGARPADVAARVGYADQPHLSREVRALAGTTPRQLASGANRSTPLPSGSSTTA
jgi:AraC-like DNA-binding protein